VSRRPPLHPCNMSYMYYWINTNMYTPTQGLPDWGDERMRVKARGQRLPERDVAEYRYGAGLGRRPEVAGDRVGAGSRAARLSHRSRRNEYSALKNPNPTEARYVRPDSDATPSLPGLTLSERRFQEFDEFLFRDRQAIGEWADGAPETAASRGLAFEERGQAPPNVADC
jgi:hypothetical protein